MAYRPDQNAVPDAKHPFRSFLHDDAVRLFIPDRTVLGAAVCGFVYAILRLNGLW